MIPVFKPFFEVCPKWGSLHVAGSYYIRIFINTRSYKKVK